MATENATTTENTARFNAMGDAQKALRELHALSDLMVIASPGEATAETVGTIGEMLADIGARMQDAVNVLYRNSEPVGG